MRRYLSQSVSFMSMSCELIRRMDINHRIIGTSHSETVSYKNQYYILLIIQVIYPVVHISIISSCKLICLNSSPSVAYISTQFSPFSRELPKLQLSRELPKGFSRGLPKLHFSSYQNIILKRATEVKSTFFGRATLSTIFKRASKATIFKRAVSQLKQYVQKQVCQIWVQIVPWHQMGQF